MSPGNYNKKLLRTVYMLKLLCNMVQNKCKNVHACVVWITFIGSCSLTQRQL